MRIYLKDTMDALQTFIITSTTDISNSEISITTYGIRNKVHRIIHTQTIGNTIKRIVILNNTKIMVDVKKIVPSTYIDLPPVGRLTSSLGCVVL